MDIQGVVACASLFAIGALVGGIAATVLREMWLDISRTNSAPQEYWDCRYDGWLGPVMSRAKVGS